ncbi:MAG TPA: transcription elongation factor GreA [Chitinophagales bacterium]|nr:transcription elongation factor GreA [Chitinophagales bacterium]
MAETTYLTAEGLEKLKKELIQMRTKGRAEIAKQIQEAREKGDLSENAEYDAAKDAQGMLEMKISKLEEALSNARIIDTSKLDTSKVMVLSKVKVKNLQTKQTSLYMLVSEKEADFKTGKISVSSPIGKGFLGKSVGEVAEIEVPSGKLKFEIIEISL